MYIRILEISLFKIYKKDFMSHPPCAEIPLCAADPLCRCFLSLLLLFSFSTLGSIQLSLWPANILVIFFFCLFFKGTQVFLFQSFPNLYSQTWLVRQAFSPNWYRKLLSQTLTGNFLKFKRHFYCIILLLTGNKQISTFLNM